MKKITSLVILATLFLTSCKKAETTETVVNETPETENLFTDCSYSIDSTKATVNWTAFKTSEKIGVGGQFDDVQVLGVSKGASISDALFNLKFNIKTASTNTNNADRDQKIITFFFGNMSKPEVISGYIKSTEGNNANGKCIASLRLNEIEKEVPLDYVFVNDTITLTGTMDVLDWNASKGLSAINNACKALHTGADGKSVTWPNVDLKIKTVVIKNCD